MSHIVNSIDNCSVRKIFYNKNINSFVNLSENYLFAQRDYSEKFQVIELTQQVITTQTHLAIFLSPDSFETSYFNCCLFLVFEFIFFLR